MTGGALKKSLSTKILIISTVVIAVIAIKYFGLDKYLSIDVLKQYRDALWDFYSDHHFMTLFLYFGSYILVTALSIPGAAVMTLAGGAIFGLMEGTILVSFASTIGATLAFLAARFVLRDWVQSRFEDKLKAINRGIEREGALYLFTLRLVPVFPFFAINLIMGLTRMSARTFYVVSQIGMLPGTIVYVNAGRELSRIRTVSDIMSFRLMVAFAMLGLLPIVAKRIVTIISSRKKEKTS